MDNQFLQEMPRYYGGAYGDPTELYNNSMENASYIADKFGEHIYDPMIEKMSLALNQPTPVEQGQMQGPQMPSPVSEFVPNFELFTLPSMDSQSMNGGQKTPDKYQSIIDNILGLVKNKRGSKPSSKIGKLKALTREESPQNREYTTGEKIGMALQGLSDVAKAFDKSRIGKGMTSAPGKLGDYIANLDKKRQADQNAARKDIELGLEMDKFNTGIDQFNLDKQIEQAQFKERQAQATAKMNNDIARQQINDLLNIQRLKQQDEKQKYLNDYMASIERSKAEMLGFKNKKLDFSKNKTEVAQTLKRDMFNSDEEYKQAKLELSKNKLDLEGRKFQSLSQDRNRKYGLNVDKFEFDKVMKDKELGLEKNKLDSIDNYRATLSGNQKERIKLTAEKAKKSNPIFGKIYEQISKTARMDKKARAEQGLLSRGISALSGDKVPTEDEIMQLAIQRYNEYMNEFGGGQQGVQQQVGAQEGPDFTQALEQEMIRQAVEQDALGF
jgi:hypothetical protein